MVIISWNGTDSSVTLFHGMELVSFPGFTAFKEPGNEARTEPKSLAGSTSSAGLTLSPALSVQNIRGAILYG